MYHSPSKRTHSPTDDYAPTTTIYPGPPARKKVIPDDMFTNQMAAMSLRHDDWRKDQVERVDDIDAYLNDGSDNSNRVAGDGDTYLGDTPELVGVPMGTTTLPFERIPGSSALRIPDFVFQPGDRDVYALAQQELQHQHQYKEAPNQHYQPMELD
jgi:hypothetical protein